MVGSTGTLMTMRLVRSKLRKREESSSAVPTIEAPSQLQSFGTPNRSGSSSGIITCDHNRQHQQQIFTTSALVVECNNSNSTNINNNNINSDHEQQQQVVFTRTSGGGIGNGGTGNNSWVFPPKAPTPNIYNCINNDALLATNESNGFKGFRKQFSGRFKRLVARKPEPTSPIPPELKPQLKTIYVY